MTFFSRSLLSIKKRKSRTILLFLAVLLIANIMAGAISIKKALIKTEELYGDAMPIVVSIEEDYLESDTDNTLSPELVTELGRSPYVKSYKYYFDYMLKSQGLRLNDNTGPNDIAPVADLTIKGTNDTVIDLVNSGILKINEGRGFTEEEIKKADNVIIISEEVAAFNNLNIGDTIKMGIDLQNNRGDYFGFTEDTYKIVGIFEAKKEYERDENGELMELANKYLDTIYMPNDSLQNIHLKIMQEKEKHNIEEYDNFRSVAIYYLNSKENLDNFKNENTLKLPKGFAFADNSSNLTTLSGPIQNMEDIADTIVKASIIASVIVIGLIMILFCKERKQEMGIYLALGERKINIALQILIETLIVAFVGVTISIFTGSLIAKNISNQIVENQFVINSGNKKSAYGSDKPTISEIIPEEQEIEVECEVNLDINTILSIYVIALGSITVSVLIPICYTLKLNPRKILM